MHRRLSVLMILAVTAALGRPTAGAERLPHLDPERLEWSRIELRASKLTVTARSAVEIHRQSASGAIARWLRPPTEQPIMPNGDDVVRVGLQSAVLGKLSELELWLDPVTAGAFQRIQLETGKKVRHHRHRSLRFTAGGVFNATHRATEETVDRPYREWDLSETFEAYPDRLPPGTVVSEPSGLFYLLAAGDLDRPGASLSTYVFSKGRVMKVDLTVWETTSIKVGYTEVSSTGSREVKGRQEVMRILLAGRALGEGGSNRDFEFLGLRGDVEIYLERTRRIPVLITGDIRYVGKGKVRLQRVDLD